MENATKALLIAGSVLIAILLIAFGLRIFNSTKGTSEAAQTTMDSTAVATFNSQFNSYFGNIKTKKDLRNLINKVIASNASSNRKVKVQLGYYSPSMDPRYLTLSIDRIPENNTYTVVVENTGYDEDGYINVIHVIYNG